MLYEFRKALSGEDATILEGRCLSYSRNITNLPIVEVFKEIFGIEETDGDFRIKDKVQAELDVLQIKDSSTLPYLLELLAPEVSGIDKDTDNPVEIKNLMIQSMMAILVKRSGLST
ncbi:MAG: hypothetical protein GY866_15530 [Proteobacteria bacterium]|nr:hypothetical protein [Pseudomonadota bacterium]